MLKIDASLLVLVLLAGLLVMPGLGGNRIWQDEGQTAVIAKNILDSGLPKASDGKNTLSLFHDRSDVREGLYNWQPWLAPYLAAASMALFDVDSFGARLPFALAFIALVALFYRFLKTWYQDRGFALACTLMLLCCVPLLVHARQCRYYLLVPLFNLLIADAYLKYTIRNEFRSLLALILWFTLLFQSFPPAILLTGSALVVHGLFVCRQKIAIKNLFIIAVLIVLVNLPWAVFARLWDREFGVQAGYSSLTVFGAYLLRYVLTLNYYFFPFVILLVVLIARFRHLFRQSTTRPVSTLAFLLCAIHLLGISLLSDYPFTRYLTGMIPFFLLLCIKGVHDLAGGRKALLYPLLAVIAITNFLHIVPSPLLKITALQNAEWSPNGVPPSYLKQGEVGYRYAMSENKGIINTGMQSPLYDYVLHILRPPKGPIDGIIDYLDENAKPGDVVQMTYGEFPLMFHMDLAVRGNNAPEPGLPDWLIIRHGYRLSGSREYLEQIEQLSFRDVELPIPDLHWNNRPDPLYHYFETPFPEDVPAIKIKKRTD